ncbi:cytochrome b [Cupriavidus basilensis]|uniref:Cytochrome b n=1 Tax=Cupriavidus basilensis TaxID=68895 RepID=A0ABT6AHI3_9BURK|nr:cytochrome b [Cupriavidus basilensis]MDF3831909.1 cytochrome b [Cupriavidus basilensis]
MAPIENSEERYGIIAILLHWSMAILVIGLAALGIYMVMLPDVGFNSEKIVLIIFHKEVGLLVFVLLLVRWVWRATQTMPALDSQLPDWQKIAARSVHLIFYFIIFALPITGWVMSSAAGIPVSFFGIFTLHDFVRHDDLLFHQLIELHRWLGFALVFFIFIHVSAALWHHFVFKDDTLRKMLP